MFRTTSAFRAPRTKDIYKIKASRPSQTSLTIQSGDSSSYKLTFVRQLLEMPFIDLQPPSRKAMTEIPIQKDEDVETPPDATTKPRRHQHMVQIRARLNGSELAVQKAGQI
ncbi:hypothetical protein CFAM422_009664 [Trichoderma lentiforme]|uniref:Uncharacterized protein n=1 Tax=Trichoderma lentiforme TaxID=1567552 RepID=A0A9P5CBF3_9HYPO|nr:hypothetical protein CFAM422_009664 [Trichoderma lentiforme]